MIDKFGQVMLYVNDPAACSRFWVRQAGFVLLGRGDGTGPEDNGIAWAEVAPAAGSDTSLVLFQREQAARQSPEVEQCTPSILFSSYNLEQTLQSFNANGITTDDIVTIAGTKTFSFADNENHYFAIREVPHAENSNQPLV